VTSTFVEPKDRELKSNLAAKSTTNDETMVKFAALSVALLAGSASAFTTSTASSRAGSVALSAEKSQSLPFLNRPALVSEKNIARATLVRGDP